MKLFNVLLILSLSIGLSGCSPSEPTNTKEYTATWFRMEVNWDYSVICIYSITYFDIQGSITPIFDKFTGKPMLCDTWQELYNTTNE